MANQKTSQSDLSHHLPMIRRLKHFLIGGVFVGLLAAFSLSVILPPQTASAAGCDTQFLTFPAWYNGITNDSCTPDISSTGGNVSKFVWKIVLNVVNIMLQLVGYLAIGYLIYGGWKYLTSAGDSSRITSAKNLILYSLIGLVLSFFAATFVVVIGDMIIKSNAPNQSSPAAPSGTIGIGPNPGTNPNPGNSTNPVNGDPGGNNTTPTGPGIVNYNTLSGSSFSAKINASGKDKYAALPAGSYTFNNFAFGSAPNFFGAYITSSKGIVGAGSKYTTISMGPNTSTRQAYAPSGAGNGQANATTNQLQYMIVQGLDSFSIKDVTIAGTNQGHLYNGLMFNGTRNVTVSNTTVTGIPGNAGSPPGETFSINLYNQPANGVATFENDTIDGKGVAAVGIGLNSVRGTVNVKNLLTKNTGYSAGVAGWQMSGNDNYYNWVNTNSVRSYNAERHSGTTNFYDPIWSQPKSGHYDINYTWEPGWQGGSINFRFSDDAAWQKFIANRSIKKITIITNPHGQGAIRNTVHIYVKGVLKNTTDYVQFFGAA